MRMRAVPPLAMLAAAVLAGLLVACGSRSADVAACEGTEKAAAATEGDAGHGTASGSAPAEGLATTRDGTPIPEGTIIEDDVPPDSLPIAEGDRISVAGTLAYEREGSVECLVLLLDEPFDAEFAAYPDEGQPELHEGVACIDVSGLLAGDGCDASAAGDHVRVRGTFAGGGATDGAHYDQDGTLLLHGGCVLRDPVLER